jgi:hypothetical protein
VPALVLSLAVWVMVVLGFGAPAAVLGALMLTVSVPLGAAALVLGIMARASARGGNAQTGPATVGLGCGALVLVSLAVIVVVSAAG